MADTYELDPAVRVEEILNGDDIEPANRLEYFLKKAATEVPKPTADDKGKTVIATDEGNYDLTPLVLKRGSGELSVQSAYTPEELTEEDIAEHGARATGQNSLAIGVDVEASGLNSVALGRYGIASGAGALAFGGRVSAALWPTTASGSSSFAIGSSCKATATNSCAIGQIVEASASATFAVGLGTKATGRGCFVAGVNNIPDENPIDTTHGAGARKYIFILGNGIYGQTPSNALTVDWDGNLVCNNIPAPPAAAGTYTLRCTVDASGAASYSWA